MRHLRESGVCFADILGTILAFAGLLAMAGCSSSEQPAPPPLNAASLMSIAVTPQSASIAPGTSQQFVATGTYTDGTTKLLTASASWTSSAPAVATIDGSGDAAGVGSGTATITAESGSISGSATLTVAPAVLAAIVVTPALPSLSPGETQQFTATGAFADGSTQDLTRTVSWSSSNTAVATISMTSPTIGLAQTLTAGTTTITASSAGVSGTTLLTVSSAVIASIEVTPSPLILAKGTTGQLAAIATYSDDSTKDISATASWTSSDTAIATVNATGVARGVQAGSAMITAASADVTGSTNVQVTAAVLVSIAVSPASASIPLGTTQQFKAIGTFNDASTQDLTGSVQWNSSNAAVATVSMASTSAGLASSVSAGTAKISATSGAVSNTANLTVTSAGLVSIAVTPARPSIVLGQSLQFTATGTYMDQSTKDITANVTWSTTNASAAIISNKAGSNGLATSSGQGMTTIGATMHSIAASTTLTVTALAAPTGFTATANPGQIALAWNSVAGATSYQVSRSTVSGGPYAALATTKATHYTDGGLPGDSTYYYVVRAINSVTQSPLSAQASATTPSTALALVSISISPLSPSLVAGGTQQFAATAHYSDSSTSDITSAATWSSSNNAVATISGTGLASAVAQGNSTIGATYESKSASTILTVSPAGSCLTFFPVDVLLTMNGTSPGTAVTASRLAAGTEIAANYLGWSNATAAETFAASKVALPAGISVNGGTSHGCGFATQALAQNGTASFRTVNMDFPGRAQNVTTSGWVVNLPPNQGSKGGYYDLVLNVGTHVPYTATLQLDSGLNDPACPDYCLEVESSGGATIHSMGNTAITPGGTIFFSMNTNWTSSGSCASQPVSKGTWTSGFATITMGSNIINTGSTVTVSGMAPSGYNGTYKVASATGATISYALKTNPGTYSSGGTAVLPAPCTRTRVYATSGKAFTQLGPTMAVSMDGSDALGVVYLGNDENGTFAGTYYLQNIMVDYTNHAWPNLPH
jgi:Big-like domain-containing protein